MDRAQATVDDRFGQSTVGTTMSLEGCDEVDMIDLEPVVITNNDNNADQAEGSVATAPGMSDANSSPTIGKKEKSGGKFPKEKGKMRFVGVRHRPSGRWVAEIRDSTQNIRLWLGTYDTTEDAARAYDDAARALRGANTWTNFGPAEDGQPESKSKAVRVLLQRAAVATRHPTISERHTTNFHVPTSSCDHTLQRQQAQQLYANPEESDSLFSHNGTVVKFSLEVDRPSSHLSAKNSCIGRGAQHHHHQSAAAGWSGTPTAPSSTVELGSSSTEEKFLKAFVEVCVQLPSQRNEDFEDRDGRTQLGSEVICKPALLLRRNKLYRYVRVPGCAYQ